MWCFGILTKDVFDWYKHSKKPKTFSNSISPNIAKALVNIATRGDKEIPLLDACCGVGTIMLEACFAGYNIEGCDINWKHCRNTRENLAFFKYDAPVYRSDIKDINEKYAAAIIDLPYNLLSTSKVDNTVHIINSTAVLADLLVVVSIADITDNLEKAGLIIKDTCKVGKRGNTVFERTVWVCERIG